MIQALAHALARLCIAVVGLPAVSIEARRAEAAKVARSNIALAIGYMDDGDDDEGGGESIDARGFGFGEYMTGDREDDDDDEGRVRS